ncbi:uncharacterized protein LOC113506082 isoform X2 [Trichoplusia ni]|uniref:Uncharacterized protein LOC113506082 isoform X2 n=1 Tax=Trichoplusia ni TaxID=7111 RepID=A0A7E5WV75_TRINI|nr:uncharacterized protein LOC113506082 isoform X2 [Trichoplusia ni]
MAITLQSLYNELKEIRTYLIKIGPKRRQGHILESKLSEANIVHEQFECWLNTYKSKLRNDDDDDPVVHSFCKQFLTLFNEIVDLCQSDKNSEDFVTMSTFDLKTALNLLPCMTDTEANTKQLIDNIEYYNSLLDKDVYFGNQLSELFVDLTISQANGKSENYSILKPLNENIAIKKFADALRDRRLSTIIAARNFSTLKDAIQAAMDEEVTTASGSGEIMEDKDEVFEEISEDGISRSRPEVHRREDIGSAVNNIEVSPEENKGYVNNLMLTL